MFPIRQIVSKGIVLPNLRAMSTKPLVDLTMDNDGIATMTLQRAKVNSLNLDLLQEMSKTLDEVTKNKNKGLVLTSAFPTVFSAGIDITELYQPEAKRARAMWMALQDVWLKIFSSNFVTAAAINGHAPAGGYILAMACEYRVMVNGKHTVGLNETALGMAIPFWIIDAMLYTISTRQTEIAINSAKMYTADEALEINLIDEIASNKTDAIEKCKQFIKRFDRIPPFARIATKRAVREPIINRLLQDREKDVDIFLKFLNQPNTQATLGTYYENMKKRKAVV